MVSVENICSWFKSLEGETRIELMCSLLDCCLPLELRFLGTYVEFLAGKYYTHLQRWEKTANGSNLEDFSNLNDTNVRRHLCIFLTLLYSHNRRTASKLFQILNNFQLNGVKRNTKEVDTVATNSDQALDKEGNVLLSEIKLLLCMASYHPAFDFDQKSRLRERTQKLHQQKLEPSKIVENRSPLSFPSNSGEKLFSQEKDTLQVEQGGEKIMKQEALKTVPEVPGLNVDSFSKPTQDACGPQIPCVIKGDIVPTTVVHSPLSLQSPYFPVQSMSFPLAQVLGQPFTSNVPFQGNQPKVGNSLMQGPPPQTKTMLSSGANGIIPGYFQAPVFNGTPGSATTSFTPLPSEFHIRPASSPIPVRPPQVYQQYAQGGYSSSRGGVAFPYGMSPLGSPCQSPFTSPLPSPITSPRPSPAQSPMFRRKSTGGIGGGKREAHNYSSVHDWLKSLRLHKYTEVFKGYTFQKMSALSDADLMALGLTQGAMKKFKLNVDALVERGFQGFGNQPCSGSATSSTDSITEQTSALAPIISCIPGKSPCDGAVPNLISSRTSPYIVGDSPVSEAELIEEDTPAIKADSCRPLLCKEASFSEKSSDEASLGTEESFDDTVSDDEVFLARRQTVIEIQDFSRKENEDSHSSCFNCGGRGHVGQDCEEETMEANTYNKYGYRLCYKTDVTEEKDNERVCK